MRVLLADRMARTSRNWAAPATHKLWGVFLRVEQGHPCKPPVSHASPEGEPCMSIALCHDIACAAGLMLLRMLCCRDAMGRGAREACRAPNNLPRAPESILRSRPAAGRGQLLLLRHLLCPQGPPRHGFGGLLHQALQRRPGHCQPVAEDQG